MINKFISFTKEKCLKKIHNFLSDSRGMGTIEMVLLILVLLGILVLFRNYIQTLIATIFAKIDSQIGNF